MNNAKYNKQSKKNNDVKEAIWKAYGKYCPICKEYLPLAELTIDRIIPEDQGELSAETLKYYYKLCGDGFVINCLENYMPMHGRENIEKGNRDLGVYQFENRLLTAKSKVNMILANMREKKITKKKDTLICELGKLAGNDNSEAEFIYNYITKQEREFEVKRDIFDAYRHYHCTFTEKNVALFLNIPKTLEEEASCLFTFTSLTISGCLITLNQNQIHDVLFNSIKTNPSKASRKFILFPDINNKQEYFIQLGNNRVTLKIEELQQLCRIIDDAYDKYIMILQNIEKAMGTTEYEYNCRVGGHKLLEIPKQLWDLLFRYSWKYDWENGKGDKYIFNKTGMQIQVNSPSSNEDFKNGIHAVLHPVENLHSISVYWKEGFLPYDGDTTLDIYNPKQKWKCNQTYEWLKNVFIPNALYEQYLCNPNTILNLFRKKLSFNEFKTTISYRDIGVYRFSSPIYRLKAVDSKRNLSNYFSSIQHLIQNTGDYIYFEYSQIISLLNVCNTLAIIFKNGSPDLKSEYSYFSINEYIDIINSMYDTLKHSNHGEDFEAVKICRLLGETCELINLDLVCLSDNILADIKIEITQFNEAIKKIVLINKYK